MRQSTDRIITSHVGSLPRSQKLVDVLLKKDHGDAAFDQAEYDATVDEAVDQAMARQVEVGIDVPSDGEQSKVSYSTYMMDRLHGFGGDNQRRMPMDMAAHPEFRAKIARMTGVQEFRRASCIGPISVKSWAPLKKDIARLTAAAAKYGVQEAFMNSASPGLVTAFQPNQYYPTHQQYVEALAEVLKEEYQLIIDAGLILHLDCPDLAMARHIGFQDLTEAEFLKQSEGHVEAMNYALEGIPAEKVRMHICWGNYEGPHDFDIPVETIMDIILKAKPAGILFEASNSRHEHEWVVWRDTKLPEDKILIPGCIDSCSNYVEHPELVAQRIERYAEIVGRERVIAATDCGFGTFAGYGKMDGEISYKKLRSLAEGAEIASRRLWAKAKAPSFA
ncbi:MAG: cobalamin-independent methionine synthase II family protein [Caulobacteraceae bacterium]